MPASLLAGTEATDKQILPLQVHRDAYVMGVVLKTNTAIKQGAIFRARNNGCIP